MLKVLMMIAYLINTAEAACYWKNGDAWGSNEEHVGTTSSSGLCESLVKS